MEQILGRVLRLPGARRKEHAELNVAYAYVVSGSFTRAAEGLRDALVENGLERYEAETLVEEGTRSEPGWTVPTLAIWLDRHIAHTDITQADARLFIHNAITSLMERTGASVEQIAQEKYRLRKALEGRIELHRSAQYGRAFQRALFEGGAGEIVVSPEVALAFGDPDRYAPNWFYEGPYQFRKHLFPRVGELGSSGEEHECAVYIDQHPLVECWVRNIANRPEHSFWLQTSTDRYYPDFVGRLTDGRVFAVESKGEHLWSGDDAKEKRAVGALWAAESDGRCIHVMPKGPEWGAIDAAFLGEAGN